MNQLIKTDVDGYIDVFHTWKQKKPTKEEIKEMLMDYHTEKQSEDAANDLMNHGEAWLNDSSCTQYKLV